MSLINMQDTVIKSSLVTQFQARGGDMARAHDATAVPYQQEQARRADEVVIEVTHTEDGGIRDERESRQGEERERQRRPRIEVPGEDGSDDENTSPPHRAANGHIDITI